MILGLLAFEPPAVAADNPQIEVREAVWTSKPSGLQPADSLASPVKRRELCLWTRIEGGAEALSRLERDGKLPIRHVWKYWVGGVPDRDFPALNDAVSLGVGSDKILKDLKQEAAAKDGSFDWRTWSCKKRMGPGEWAVEVNYRDSTPVQCGEKPCVYRVTITP
jgi:hypothetical protein